MMVNPKTDDVVPEETKDELVAPVITVKNVKRKTKRDSSSAGTSREPSAAIARSNIGLLEAPTTSSLNSADTRKAKLQAFQAELEKEAESQKYRELHRFICVGEALPSEKQLKRVTQKREKDVQSDRSTADKALQRPHVKHTTIIHPEAPKVDYQPTFDEFHSIDWEGKVRL